MTEQYSIAEKFEITGRGVVVVIDEVTGRVPGTVYKVELKGAYGDRVVAEALKEWLLRRCTGSFEKEAYFLSGLHKTDVPEHAVLVFI
ncbi:hypothetical protein [Marinobacter xestospongiae]|uniref:hypothetical protein n=1 Tax=Marinobacter xestospongiae TaxID=994319 RepID=UPI0020038748|nr:hypothetical protein [Marinobacter xestospongiae]MCK7568462.1 hypothetical protein [Marinobacter xestospongiae]